VANSKDYRNNGVGFVLQGGAENDNTSYTGAYGGYGGGYSGYSPPTGLPSPPVQSQSPHQQLPHPGMHKKSQQMMMPDSRLAINGHQPPVSIASEYIGL